MKSLFVDVPQALRSNFASWYWDISVWGLYTGSTVVFLTVYATRAGATSEQIGLLSAGPAIVALLTSIPLGLLARRFPAKRGVVIAAFLARTMLLAYVLIPGVVPAADRINALLAITLLMAFPNTLLGICFGPFFLSTVPREWRATVVGIRNALNSIISFFITLLCGQLLVHLVFPLGYQAVFFIGFIGAVLTIWTLASVKVFNPHPPAAPTTQAATAQPTPPAPSAPTKLPPLRALFPTRDPAGRHYMVVVGMLFAINAVTFMTAPLLPQFTVHQLRLNDAVISIGSAVSSMLVFAVSLFVIRLARRYGNRTLTAIGAVMLCFQMVVLAAAQDSTLYLASSLIGGSASGIMMAAQFNYHLENVPRLDQTVWISWNSLLGNGAALLGSIAGPALAALIGIPATLIAMGLLRLLIGLAIYFWG